MTIRLTQLHTLKKRRDCYILYREKSGEFYMRYSLNDWKYEKACNFSGKAVAFPHLIDYYTFLEKLYYGN